MPTIKSIMLEFACDGLVCIIFYILGMIILSLIGDEYLYVTGFIMGLISAVVFITITMLLKLIREVD